MARFSTAKMCHVAKLMKTMCCFNLIIASVLIVMTKVTLCTSISRYWTSPAPRILQKKLDSSFQSSYLSQSLQDHSCGYGYLCCSCCKSQTGGSQAFQPEPQAASRLQREWVTVGVMGRTYTTSSQILYIILILYILLIQF